MTLPPSLIKCLQDLEQELKSTAPNINNYLQLIHNDLKSSPELTYILSDEQIGAIYKATMISSNTVLVADKVKAAKKAAKVDKSAGVDELLGF